MFLLEADFRCSYAQAHFRLGSTRYCHANDVEHAIESYEEAIRLDPNHVGAWIFLGDAYENSGPYQQAIDVC